MLMSKEEEKDSSLKSKMLVSLAFVNMILLGCFAYKMYGREIYACGELFNIVN